jgi:hypothetical protein
VRKKAVAIIFLFVFACLPFLPTLRAGFLNWDDDFYLTENPDIVSPEGWRNTLSRFTTDANVYPVVFASFRLEHRLWGFHPLSYHSANVILHGLVAVSGFILLLALGAPKRVAWGAALLFAVHPMQASTVAWVSERKSLLGTFFILWSWIVYIRANRAEPDPPNRPVGFTLSWILALLGYLSKSSLVVFPWLLLVTERIRKEPIRMGAWVHVALAGMVGVIYAGRETGPDFSLPERLFIACRSFWYYAIRSFFPAPDGGVQPKWDTSAVSLANWIALGGVLLSMGALYRYRKKLSAIEWIGAAIFLVSLAPSLGFLTFGYQQHAYVSDHFAYSGLLGLALFAVSVLYRITVPNSTAQAGLLASIVVVLSSLSWAECEVWRSSENFWRATIGTNPNSWVARQNLATELDRQGRIQEAQDSYREAVRLEPENPVGWINLGRSQIRSGSEEQALESLNRAIDLNPHYREAYGFLAEALSRLGRFEEALEARKKEQDLRE